MTTRLVNPAATLATGFIDGLILSNNATDAANDIDFGPGVAAVGGVFATNSSTVVKRLDASWATGNNQGGLFTGAKAGNTWYHCFVMRGFGRVDFGFDTSVSGANAPTGWVVRRIGSVLTDGSSFIRPFVQIEDSFFWKSPITDVSISSGAAPTVDTNYTLSIPQVPLTVDILSLHTGSTAGPYPVLYLLSPLATSSIDIQRAQVDSIAIRQTGKLPTNNAQIIMRSSQADTTLLIRTLSWTELRGKR